MDDRRRVTATERESLMRTNLALNFLLQEPSNLERRTAMIEHGADWLDAARDALERYMEAVYRTIPAEQLMTIHRSLLETSYTVGIKCSATANVNRDKEYGVIVPLETLNALFAACEDHCLTCMNGTEEQRRCDLRKALDMMPNDSEDRQDDGCPYRALM